MMQVRDFLFFWHVLNHTKGDAVQNAAWAQLDGRSGTEPLDLAWLTPDQRALLADADARAVAQAAYKQQRFITRLDAAYPPRLMEAYQPPPVLFYAGDLRLLRRLTLVVVGARKAGEYTKRALQTMLPDLGPVVVASGLARGADAAAHQVALAAGLGTIAVIANGLDRVYPKANRQLQAQIAQQGLVLSEYPVGTPPAPFRFVARNRILAGLAHGVLVTEAAAHSGSLITANLALQGNREVFALPNRFDAPLGAGTNALIQAGAKAVVSAGDLLEELQYYA